MGESKGDIAVMIHSDMWYFKQNIREKGGIWASDHVYFSQFRDGFSASYRPNFPEHSPEDCSITYNWVKDEWHYFTPDIYDAEYNRIGGGAM